MNDAAAASSSFHASSPAACCIGTPTTTTTTTLEIDLRVTKETLHIIHVASLAWELQNYAEWTLSRNHVPYALAQKGMTLYDWTDVFDKVDALWERRTTEAIDVDRELRSRRRNRSRYMIAFYLVTFVLLGAIITFGFMIAETWIAGLGFGAMAVIPIVAWVLITRYELKLISETLDINKANMEYDWTLLAEEQRRKFEAMGVDVQPIREDHSGKYGKMLSSMLGRDFTITDGLRFSFADQEAQHMPSTSTKEDALLMPSKTVPTVPVAAIHDLDRLLQLNQQSCDVNTEEYQLLKSRILSKMSFPFQYESIHKWNTTGVQPEAAATIMTAVAANDHGAGADIKRAFMEIV